MAGKRKKPAGPRLFWAWQVDASHVAWLHGFATALEAREKAGTLNIPDVLEVRHTTAAQTEGEVRKYLLNRNFKPRCITRPTQE